MKKIVSTALAAALLAGAATAETTIANNFRIRPNMAEWNTGTEADATSRYFNMTAQSAADTLTFKSSTDYAGVSMAFSNNAAAKTVSVDSFSGWLKFGALKFTGMNDSNRFANRVTADQNNLSLLEQNWGATYNTAKSKSGKWITDSNANKVLGNKKLGVNANSGATIGIDSDNIGAINGSGVLSFQTEYTLDDVAGGKLSLAAAINNKAKDRITKNDNGDVETEVDATYAFRLGYKASAFDADANLHLQKNMLAASAFVSPKVDKLTSTFGVTFAQDKSTTSKTTYSDDAIQIDDTYYIFDATAGYVEDEGTTALTENDSNWLAFDARARYAVSDQLAVTGMVNYTICTIKQGVDGASVKKVKDKGKNGGILDAVLNATFKVNDTVKAFGEVEYVGDFRDYASKKKPGSVLAAQLGTILTAGKGAELDVAGRCVMAGLGNDYEKDTLGTQIQIPVCMRIKL